MSNIEEWTKGGLKFQAARLGRGLPAPEEAGLFGLSLSESESELVILPVGWEATASYGGGTASTPNDIVGPSHQLDLFDLRFGEPFNQGICLAEGLDKIPELGDSIKRDVDKVREFEGDELNKRKFESALDKVNTASEEVNNLIYEKSKKLLNQKKRVALLGGDHSCPYGLIKALGELHDEFAILHVDAHFDFRDAYEGFRFSHASIMHNVMKDIDSAKAIYQVGIRDFSKQEWEYQRSLGENALVHYSSDVFNGLITAGGAEQLLSEMNEFLPQKVYISFDIDGLDPKLCPGTGTPVPGGLEFEYVSKMLASLSDAGKEIIGFDLCEVASPEGSEWDLNVGARILYKLCGLLLENK